MVLVLLVILMVASTYIVAQTLKVQLPQGARRPTAPPRSRRRSTILKNGSLRWNEEPIAEAELPAKMKEAVAADPEMSLVVSADKEVQHGNVVHVLDMAKLAGVTKFAINVQQSGE